MVAAAVGGLRPDDRFIAARAWPAGGAAAAGAGRDGWRQHRLHARRLPPAATARGAGGGPSAGHGGGGSLRPGRAGGFGRTAAQPLLRQPGHRPLQRLAEWPACRLVRRRRHPRGVGSCLSRGAALGATAAGAARAGRPASRADRVVSAAHANGPSDLQQEPGLLRGEGADDVGDEILHPVAIHVATDGIGVGGDHLIAQLPRACRAEAPEGGIADIGEGLVGRRPGCSRRSP